MASAAASATISLMLLWTATSVSCGMSGTPERETAIVSRPESAGQGFPVLFRLRPRLLDHARQSLRFAAHAGGELLGRVPAPLEAEPLEPLANLRRMQRTQVLAVELRDHRRGRAVGSHRAEPSDQLEPGQPRLGDGRKLGCQH